MHCFCKQNCFRRIRTNREATGLRISQSSFLRKTFPECLLVQQVRAHSLGIETNCVKWSHHKKIKTLDLFLQKSKAGFLSQVEHCNCHFPQPWPFLTVGPFSLCITAAAQRKVYLTSFSYPSSLSWAFVSPACISPQCPPHSSVANLQTKQHVC